MDLNSDLAEGGEHDRELLAIVTSANVACGFHAGSPELMRTIVREARARGVAIGAHPGYHDREGFGRRELGHSPERIERDTTSQLKTLEAICAEEGAVVEYVKPHGALYNRCVQDAVAARAVISAVRKVLPTAAILALADSRLLHDARRAGMQAFSEAFADRGYSASGELLPRSAPGALISDPVEAAARALDIALSHRLQAADGSTVNVDAHSICVHGDTPGALEIASRIRSVLANAGLTPAPFVQARG